MLTKIIAYVLNASYGTSWRKFIWKRIRRIILVGQEQDGAQQDVQLALLILGLALLVILVLLILALLLRTATFGKGGISEEDWRLCRAKQSAYRCRGESSFCCEARRHERRRAQAASFRPLWKTRDADPRN